MANTKKNLGTMLWSFMAMLRSPGGGAALGALIILLVLLPVWWQVNRWYRNQRQLEQKNQAEVELSLRASALSAALNRRLVLLEGLGAFVQAEVEDPGLQKNFDTFASSLYNSTPGIQSIAVAPGGVVFYVYPFAENQKYIGYNPLQDPDIEIRRDAQLAIDSGTVVISGPFLLEGGIPGITARQAVYRNGSYWGMVQLSLDLTPILERGALEPDIDQPEIAIRDSFGRLVYGPDANFQSDALIYRFQVADDYWELANLPAGGWLASIEIDLRIFQITSLTILLLLTGLGYLSINRQQQLSLAVDQRTQIILRVNEQLQMDILERQKTEAALRERESQYRSIFESAQDGLFINTLQGEMVDFNPTAAHMHGYTVEEFRQLQPVDFIHPASYNVFAEYIETISSGGQFRARAVDRHKNGSLIHVEVIGTQFIYQGQPHTLAVVRDVTDQVEAYQLLEQRVAERTRELFALLEVSRNVASTLEVEPLLSDVLKQLKTVVDFTGAALLTLEEGEFAFRDYIGPAPADKISNLHIPANIPSYFKDVVDGRAPVIVSDLLAESPARVAELKQVRKILGEDLGYARSWLGVPLQVKDRLIGVLRVDHEEPDHFDETDARLVLAFANQAAVAIENARLYEQARSLASLQERQRLARDLHDSVSQALYGIALGARTARVLVERGQANQAGLSESLDYVLSLAEAGLAEMRALIFELRPESLEQEGLAVALSKQADATRARYHINVEVELCDEPPISLTKKEALYRVAQEGLHNVVKHAQATNIRLVMNCDQRYISVTVYDDGAGFDPSQNFPGHLGLHSMRERIERHAGSLTIESAPGEGTTLIASLPVDG